MIGPRSRTIRRRPSPQPTFAGLRRHDRKPARLQIYLRDSRGWEMEVESINISQGGILIASPYMYREGELHELRVVTGRELLMVRARVIRVEPVPGRSGTVAVAYSFVETSRETWSRLRELVARV